MSRTVRYFKLVYIVAGILLRNAAICETVDQIQIAPRLSKSVETKEKQFKQHATKNVVLKYVKISEKTTDISKRWYHKFLIFKLLQRTQRLLWCQWRVFSVWTFFNFFIECSTRLLCRTFVINSDCDVIYK